MVFSLYYDEGQAHYQAHQFEKSLEAFQNALGVGDERAIPKVGLAAYQSGNFKLAVDHCQKYIQHGDCKVILGVCYYSGNGVAENYEKSERLLKGAASEGHRLAKLNLSILFGAMDNKNEEEYFWCNEAAIDGNNSAIARLKILIAEGRGIPPYRYAEYVTQLKENAEKSCSQAQFKLGSHYHYGQFGLPVDHKEATKWYERSAQQGNYNAMNNLGTIYEHSDQVPRDLTVASRYYADAIKTCPTFTPAVINLADLYMTGRGVNKDLSEALRLLESVEGLDADAKAALARLYASGEEGFNDAEKVKKYQQEAAEGGSIVALRDLAKSSTGSEAVQYLHEAATAGDISSQIALGKDSSEKGDFADALYWIEQVSSKGNLEGREMLTQLGYQVENALFS